MLYVFCNPDQHKTLVRQNKMQLKASPVKEKAQLHKQSTKKQPLRQPLKQSSKQSSKQLSKQSSKQTSKQFLKQSFSEKALMEQKKLKLASFVSNKKPLDLETIKRIANTPIVLRGTDSEYQLIKVRVQDIETLEIPSSVVKELKDLSTRIKVKGEEYVEVIIKRTDQLVSILRVTCKNSNFYRIQRENGYDFFDEKGCVVSKKNGFMSETSLFNGKKVVTSGFGPRYLYLRGKRRRTFHSGLDFSIKHGTEIRAVRGGIVRFAGYRYDYGNLVEIENQDGTKFRYAHLSKLSVLKGDIVEEDEQIGLSGSTGMSSGPHLHLEVVVNNKRVDPFLFFGSEEDRNEKTKSAEPTDLLRFLFKKRFVDNIFANRAQTT